jgi:uncharacterized membrane protein YciS (DUF1049 family)
MSWVALLVAAWIGFILGYVVCGLMSFNSSLWNEADND